MTDPAAPDTAAPDTAATTPGETTPAETGTVTRDTRRRRSRTVRSIRIAGISLLGLIAAAVIAFLVWTNITFAATEAGRAAAHADDRIAIRVDGDLVVMEPTGAPDPALQDQGLVFLAGAKVDPEAYVPTFRAAVAEGLTVVIVRPILNMAILEWRDFSTFTAAAPDVTTWAVGGHSQGGVRACTYAERDDVTGLVLLGSYCSLGDLSDRDDLSAISVTGSRDGLLKRDAADASRELMPAQTAYVELEGVNHAQFGDYGPQPGDRDADVSDADARAKVSAAILDFFTRA
ncbi:alpha/beta hydrolase [Microbacterium thalli]|uniref:alpha/beta hydrolase n=1 Tax=Microbacterium thalli TaxID=3027921 RepID=UPI0023665ABA|nr:alpha/beta hydrolase [Microbacterium thalli]MDD7928192.1 alpha/beta hydrolase [Microbacterium thalli]